MAMAMAMANTSSFSVPLLMRMRPSFLPSTRRRPPPLPCVFGGAELGSSSSSSPVPVSVSLHVTAITSKSEAAAFQPFGQVVWPEEDGTPYEVPLYDASLDLSAGQPRFYMMRIPPRGLEMDRITYHADVTQCLASMQDSTWHLVVAEPSDLSKPPTAEQLHAFAFKGGCIVKLNKGTWHAGPLFDGEDEIAFYNLELADTNTVDHNTHIYEDEVYTLHT
ncbi:ureidoglycolate lyase [Pseudoscourfieldia marina]